MTVATGRKVLLSFSLHAGVARCALDCACRANLVQRLVGRWACPLLRLRLGYSVPLKPERKWHLTMGRITLREYSAASEVFSSEDKNNTGLS